MATRSVIGYVEPNGSIVSVYCHWDGYPEHNGKKLVLSYAKRAKVKRLLERGDFSALTDNIRDIEYYADREKNWYDAEESNPPKEHDDINAFANFWHDSGCEYFYLLTRQDAWAVSTAFDICKFSYVEDVLKKVKL